jgi:hypothetical protein
MTSRPSRNVERDYLPGSDRLICGIVGVVLKGRQAEKLFDCFFAGTVPVYWGAPHALDWVSAHCFVEKRQFTDFAQLRAFLHTLPQSRLREYREAAPVYLASNQFKPYRLEAFNNLIAGIVAADAGIAA